MENIAFGAIDAQRGFMPLEEGRRTHAAGFGELPVENGQLVVSPINALLQACDRGDNYTFTTQDWHPAKTAHFADQPDFTTTWPTHCVARTPGAELHPGLHLPRATERFVKGTVPLRRGQDDTSYSAYYAHSLRTHDTLPNRLQRLDVRHLYVAGLALDYCVGKTALDMRTRLGIDVTVVTDASRSIAAESERAMLNEFKKRKIATITTHELLGQLAGRAR